MDRESAASFGRKSRNSLPSLEGARAGRVLPPDTNWCTLLGLTSLRAKSTTRGSVLARFLTTCTSATETWPKHGLTQQFWRATSRVAYRIDGLDSPGKLPTGSHPVR